MSELIAIRKEAQALGIEVSGKKPDELKALIKAAKAAPKGAKAAPKAKGGTVTLEILAKAVKAIQSELGLPELDLDGEETPAAEEEEAPPVKKEKAKPAKEEKEEEEEETEEEDGGDTLDIDDDDVNAAKEPQLREWAAKINDLVGEKVVNVKEKDIKALKKEIIAALKAHSKVEPTPAKEEKTPPKGAKKAAKEEEETEEEEEFGFDVGDTVQVTATDEDGDETKFVGEIKKIKLKAKSCIVTNSEDDEDYEVEFSDISEPKKKGKKLDGDSCRSHFQRQERVLVRPPEHQGPGAALPEADHPPGTLPRR